MGHVIIVGRGSNVVTTQTPNVFHVRLVAPLAQRVEYTCKSKSLTPKEAAKWVEKLDHQRALYVKTNFRSHIDDPLLYHAVINTGRMSYTDAAQLIADGARRHFKHETGDASTSR
jgi:cytidylate kinase